MNDTAKSRPALSAQRALQVISFMTVNSQLSFTLSELASSLEISPASMHAVLAALTESGFLVRHSRHKTYSLGPALVTAGDAAALRHPVVGLAKAEMRQFALEGYESMGSLAIGDQIHLLALDGRPSARTHDLYIGQQMPLLPPLGQVFIAWLPRPEIEAWLDHVTPEMQASEREYLRESVGEVAKRGYSIALRSNDGGVYDVMRQLARRPIDKQARADLVRVIRASGETFSPRIFPDPEPREVGSIAAPIFDAYSRVVFAITLLEIGEKDGAAISALAERLIRSTSSVTRLIGGRPPGNGPGR